MTGLGINSGKRYFTESKNSTSDSIAFFCFVSLWKIILVKMLIVLILHKGPEENTNPLASSTPLSLCLPSTDENALAPSPWAVGKSVEPEHSVRFHQLELTHVCPSISVPPGLQPGCG